MFATEPRRYWTFLEGVEDCVSEEGVSIAVATIVLVYLRWSEELFQHDIHASEHLCKKEVVAGLVQRTFSLIEALRSRQSVALWRWSGWQSISRGGRVKL